MYSTDAVNANRHARTHARADHVHTHTHTHTYTLPAGYPSGNSPREESVKTVVTFLRHSTGSAVHIKLYKAIKQHRANTQEPACTYAHTHTEQKYPRHSTTPPPQDHENNRWSGRNIRANSAHRTGLSLRRSRTPTSSAAGARLHQRADSAHGRGLRFKRSHTPTTISAAMRTMIVHSSIVLLAPRTKIKSKPGSPDV